MGAAEANIIPTIESSPGLMRQGQIPRMTPGQSHEWEDERRARVPAVHLGAGVALAAVAGACLVGGPARVLIGNTGSVVTRVKAIPAGGQAGVMSSLAHGRVGVGAAAALLELLVAGIGDVPASHVGNGGGGEDGGEQGDERELHLAGVWQGRSGGSFADGKWRRVDGDDDDVAEGRRTE